MPLHVALLTACIHTCTSSTVQGETLSALAAERALGVHTTAICAHSREHLTFINVFTDEALHTSKPSRAGSVDLTGFTGASPGSSQCGAALRLQCGSIDVDLAAVVLYRQPACTLHTVHADGVGGVQLAAVGALAVEGPSHVATRSIDARAGIAFVDIFTGLRVGFEDISFRTGAGVGARSVSAQTVVTKQTIHQTLIDVNTVFATGVRLVTNVTDAAITSSQVLTYAVLTNFWVQGTLIDVSAISCNANATAAYSLELS